MEGALSYAVIYLKLLVRLINEHLRSDRYRATEQSLRINQLLSFYVGMLVRKVNYKSALLDMRIITVNISCKFRIFALQLRNGYPWSTERLQTKNLEGIINAKALSAQTEVRKRMHKERPHLLLCCELHIVA